MTAEKRELINKCRRDAYHAKKANRPQLSAEQKKANVKGVEKRI